MLCFTMGHNSSWYQVQINYYRDKLWYASLMVSIEQRPVANTHTKKKKKYQHTIKESHQTTKEENERRKKWRGTIITTIKQLVKW